MRKDIIMANKAPKPVGAYPHARKVGPFLYLSGVGPRSEVPGQIPGIELDSNGQIISRDIKAQCHSVFQNVQNILQASGADYKDLVDITVFLTHMKEDFTIFNSIYKEYFEEFQPCRTTVEVLSLPTPISIELKCIAYLKSVH